ncbi:hypothetical protein [uncultured Litoreibacter sp.]|uniref:hypothetical protein n=1 Tax=uncultured Litoreibacter sp. TaxID=1392394 RepID=UPI00261B01EA|nr:hypothetical protein [uncultured Litoreibacter sp.]
MTNSVSEAERTTTPLLDTSEFSAFEVGTAEAYGNDSAVLGPPKMSGHSRALEALSEHRLLIEVTALENNLNLDFFMSLIYVEVAYFSAGENLPIIGSFADSQLPANINLEIWGHLTPEKYNSDQWSAEEKSIATAATLLAEIRDSLEVPNFESIATLYNNQSNIVNSSYGLTVAQAYRDMPWDDGSDNNEYPSLQEQANGYWTSENEITQTQGDLQERPHLIVASSHVQEGETLWWKVEIVGDPVDHDITFRATTFQGTTSDFSTDGRSPDYDGIDSTWTIGARQSYVLIPVQTRDDTEHEGIEVLELQITDIVGAVDTELVGFGTILDYDPSVPTFNLAEFNIEIQSGELEVGYTISHDWGEDVTGTIARFWLSQDGTLENAIQIGSESAGILSEGEQNLEGESIDLSTEFFGEWQLITTLEADGVEQFVYRTDDVDLGEQRTINLSLEDVSLASTSFGDGVTDLEASFTVVNSGNTSTAGLTEGTAIYWSADAHFDATEDIRIDYDTHGTLYAGEHDAEFERTNAEDLGFEEDGFIFLVVDPDNEIAETDETDNVSGPIAVTFETEHEGPDIDLSIEDVTFREDRLLSQGEDVRADFVVVNSGSESTEGMQASTGIFWSADEHFDFNEDIMIDADTHGTLYAGEHDSEYERTHYEDIPTGQGYLFYVVDPLNMIAETNEANNVSDAHMVWVL